MKLALSCAMLITTFCVDARSQTTSLVSVDSNGVQANTLQSVPHVSISGDGRFVVFESDATNLVANDTNGVSDAFLRDLQANTTTRVSVDSSGVQGNDASEIAGSQALSSDGRFVVFTSTATNLVARDTNGFKDVFVRDRLTGETTLVSADSLGVQADADSYSAAISADGRYVAFESEATNLAPADTNSVADVFVHDRATHRTMRVSFSSTGEQANGASHTPSISGDGRFVAFQSLAGNLVLDPRIGGSNVYVRDLSSGVTTIVSVDSNGVPGHGGSGSIWPSISADGRFVAFESGDTSFVQPDSNHSTDVFVHDRVTALTICASVNSAGQLGWIFPGAFGGRPSVSADGRYVAFFSIASNLDLTHHDTNSNFDVFVHDLRTGETERESVGVSGSQSNNASYYPAISGDGSYVAFTSRATNLVASDTNGPAADVFVRGRLAHHVVEIESYCFGDGTTATVCPCFNFGSAHRGCASSEVASGAGLATTGQPSNDTLVFAASGEPSTSLTLFLQGSMDAAGGIVFGDGVRCVSGTLTRLYSHDAVDGSASAPDAGEESIRNQSALLGDPIAP
jgi:Tol biopolymer transport system component